LYSVTDSAGRTQLFTADTTDWRPHRLASGAAALFESDSTFNSGQAVWWDEDGRAIYGLAPHGVVVIAMPEGTVRSISRAPAGYEALKIMGPQAPATARSEGGRSLVVAIRNDSTKRMGFARVDLATGAWRILAEDDRYIGERRFLASDVRQDGRMVYVSQDAQHPPDIWTAGPGLDSPRQLTHLAPEMERVTFGQSRLIEFTTATGAPRRATLLLPAGYRTGQRYPLVVYPYPVDQRSNDVNVFGVTGQGVENMQLLATRGFAVLAPDVFPYDSKDLMREVASIIQRGVDRAIELGVADSTRLGIMGHSFGGYTTLAMIVQTDRFGAAVMRGGHGDQVSLTGDLQAGGFAFGLQLTEVFFGATPWEQPELYHRNSPIYLLDRVHTPLLIVHGEAETTVPIFLADQVFAGLQRLGKQVEFARYVGEDHAEMAWTYANQRDYLTRMIGWFESHLNSAGK
jgi:dipeptidyl aminopeptidase/acylaminoacyl peptidase